MMARNKKWISVWVLVAFFWLVQVASAPRLAAGESANSETMAVEKSSPAPVAAKKKSILPLVLAGVGVVAAAALLYFLVIKKDKERVHEDFDGAADPLWLPRTASAWTVAGGYYVCQKALGGGDNTKWWEWSLYNRSWSKANYTVTLRVRVVDQMGPYGILLSNDSSMQNVGGYQVMFSGGQYFIRKVDGWNYSNSTASSYTWIKPWTASTAIQAGLGSWNTIKLVKAGSAYQLIVNDSQVDTFTEATYDPRLVAIAVHTQTQAMHMEVDSFYVDLN